MVLKIEKAIIFITKNVFLTNKKIERGLNIKLINTILFSYNIKYYH